MFVVARDGSPVWQVIRAVVAAAVVGTGWLGVQRGGLQRIAAGLALAWLAVPVGIGIGVPHLAAVGLSVATVAGVLVLFGGLTVFSTALIAVARRAGRVLAVPASAGAVIVLIVMGFTLGQAVAATNVPRTDLGSRTPADEGLAFRDVTFPAADGTPLSGWFVPGLSEANVVLLHGAGSTRSNVLDHAVALAGQGLGVLLFDARGHGRSGGRAMDFGWFGDDDIDGAIQFLVNEPGVDPARVAVVGLSMGGEQALGAAATNPSIRAVVAEGATNRVAGDKAWLSDVYGVRGTVTEGIGVLTTCFADLLTSAGPPVELREAVRRGVPTLLIAGGAIADEVHAGRYLQSASPATVELWVAPDTPHTAALRMHPDEWTTRVTSFLSEALGVRLGEVEPRVRR